MATGRVKCCQQAYWHDVKQTAAVLVHPSNVSLVTSAPGVNILQELLEHPLGLAVTAGDVAGTTTSAGQGHRVLAGLRVRVGINTGLGPMLLFRRQLHVSHTPFMGSGTASCLMVALQECQMISSYMMSRNMLTIGGKSMILQVCAGSHPMLTQWCRHTNSLSQGALCHILDLLCHVKAPSLLPWFVPSHGPPDSFALHCRRDL